MRELVKRWESELGDTYVLGFVRALVGIFLFWQALKSGEDLSAHGYFGDSFHTSFLPDRFIVSRALYTAIIAARVLLAVLVVTGHRARPSLALSAVLGLYVMLCDRTQYHHNRYAVLLFAFLLSLSPCDRSFAISASRFTTRIGPLWAQRLAQVQMSIIYIASGGSKLLDPDWRAGLVLADRFARHGHEALEKGVPAGLVELLSAPWATSGLAKAAIATELFLAVGLWLPRTRVFALWWGLMFHLTIEVTSKVELFTWTTLAIYALFVTPDVAARKLYFDPSRPRGVLYARAVAALDWLARFDVRAWEPDGLKKGHTIVIVRRDGTRATGIRALAMVARCVPLLFPLWAPLALVASFTKGGEVQAAA